MLKNDHLNARGFACIVLLPVLSLVAQASDTKPATQKFIASTSGRFVFGQISDFRADQFLLDTQTGRLWQIVVNDKQEKKLQPVPFLQLTGGEAYTPEPAQESEEFRLLVKKLFSQTLTKKN